LRVGRRVELAALNQEPVMMAQAKAGTFRAAWRHRPWRRFLMSFAVSSIGDFLYAVALVVYLIDETGSPAWIAAALIGRMAAFTLLGPIGGVIADRFDRRRLMVVLDLARAGVLAGAAISIGGGGPPIVLLVLVILGAVLTTPYRPAGVAATPRLVGEDDLAAANAAEAALAQVAWFAGPAIGAALVALSGPSLAFWGNSLTFLLSAVLVAGIGDIGGGQRAGADDDEASDGMRAQLVEGTRAVRQVPGLMALTLILGAVLFAFGIEQVVQVLVVQDRLGTDAGKVGVLTACVGAGGVLAIPFAPMMARRGNTGQLLAVSGLLMGLPLALLAVTSHLWVAGALMVVEGVGNIMLDVLFVTLLQRACPEALLGRVYSLQDSAGSLAQLAGTVAAPLLVSNVNLEVALMVGGGALVGASLLLLPPLRAISARTEAERLRLAPFADALGALGIFGEASQAARERLARNIVVTTVAADQWVFREGDEPADLYVIRSGELIVSTEAEGEVRRLAEGDWFGEIGLLRGVPRTATITVAEDAELWAIPGAVFVDAVGSQDRMPEPLAAAMGTRLARTHPHLVDAG
jgi:MFS family permease